MKTFIAGFAAASMLLVFGNLSAQNMYVKVAPQLNIMNLSYSSPWQRLVDFGDKSSWQMGADIGFFYQPRMANFQIRYSAGVYYTFVELHAKIRGDAQLEEGFIITESLKETYQMITVPVKFEYLYTSRYSRLAPGVSVAFNNSFLQSSKGESKRVDGGSDTYDIPAETYIPSVSLAALVDIFISRGFNLELFGGYTYALKNIFKDSESTPLLESFDAGAAKLFLHSFNVGAGVFIRVR